MQNYVDAGVTDISFGRDPVLRSVPSLEADLPPSPLPNASAGGGAPGEPFYLPESHLGLAMGVTASTGLALSLPGLKNHRALSGRVHAQDSVLLTGQTRATGLVFVVRRRATQIHDGQYCLRPHTTPPPRRCRKDD